MHDKRVYISRIILVVSNLKEFFFKKKEMHLVLLLLLKAFNLYLQAVNV